MFQETTIFLDTLAMSHHHIIFSKNWFILPEYDRIENTLSKNYSV
jgi:hypothetical protein